MGGSSLLAGETHGEDQVDGGGGGVMRRAGGPGRRRRRGHRGLATGPAFREGNLAASPSPPPTVKSRTRMPRVGLRSSEVR